MKEKKDQFVIAYLADLDNPDTVLTHAVALARMLGKGLILLYISDPRYTDLTPDEAGSRLQALRSQVQSDGIGGMAPLADVSHCALKNETKPVVDALPTLLNAVIAVAQVDDHARRRSPTHKKELLRNFSECKIAFLTVQQPLSGFGAAHDVAFSVDHRKESKEKLIWASYFARFNASTMHVLYYDYRDEGLRYKWYSNMQFMHRFFSNLKLTFAPHVLRRRTTFADVSALDYASASGYGLFIAVTTSERDGVEFFIGVQEDRIIVNRHRIPVLFINPRDDIYVLCD